MTDGTRLRVRCDYSHYYTRGVLSIGKEYDVIEISEGGRHYRLVGNDRKVSTLPVRWFSIVGDDGETADGGKP